VKDDAKADSDSSSLLITIEEAARRLSIGRSHIYEQMQRGALRSVHIGRSRRILNSDLEAFIGQLLNNGQDLRARHVPPRRQPPIKRVPLRAGRR
jgi:excisionase family DNA binding protein